MPKRSRQGSRQPSPEPVVSNDNEAAPVGYVLVAGSNDCGQLGIVGFGKRAKPGAPAVNLPPADAADSDLNDETRTILQQQPLFLQSWWSTRTARQVAAGAIHSICLLRGNIANTSSTSNSAVTFGATEDEQCGAISALTGREDKKNGNTSDAVANVDPDDIPDYFPTPLIGLPADTIQIAAGDAFTAALTDSAGHVYLTGTLRSTQGGFACYQGLTRVTGVRNLRLRRASATKTPSSSSSTSRGVAPHARVTKIVAGSSHLAVLDENGNVYTMGRFQEGQLGRIAGAKKTDRAGNHIMENWALQLEQVTVTRSNEQLHPRGNAAEQKLVDEKPEAKKRRSAAPRSKLSKTTARFSNVWATPLGLFLRDAELDAVYACGSNSAGQLGLPLKWRVQAKNLPPPPRGKAGTEAERQNRKVEQILGYFRGRKVVRFRQKGAAVLTADLQNVTAEQVDNNLLDLDITVEFPEHVPGLDGLDIVQIVGSEVHTIALTRLGDVYVFGSNKFYALGLNQAQLCKTFLRDMNKNRLSSADEIDDDEIDEAEFFTQNLNENDEILQERIRDPIFIPITRLLAASSVPPTSTESESNAAGTVDGGEQTGKQKKRRKVATAEPVDVAAPVVASSVALRDGEPIESIAAGSRQSYFITRKAGRLYRCGDNNNKLMFVRVLDDLEDDPEKYVENVDYLTRGSDNVQDVALLRPLLYESEVLNGTNRVLQVSVGGQHALLLAQRNQ